MKKAGQTHQDLSVFNILVRHDCYISRDEGLQLINFFHSEPAVYNNHQLQY